MGVMILRRDQPPIVLADEVKRWRGKVPVRVAAESLCISKRTLEGIEQGRSFSQARMLMKLMGRTDPNEGENNG